MSDDDLPELTPEQIAAFHRAAATLKDEDFSPDELAGIRKGFLQLTKDKAHEGKIWYEQPKIRNLPERGVISAGARCTGRAGPRRFASRRPRCRPYVFGRARRRSNDH